MDLGLAGEMAAEAAGPLPGTFRVKLFDSIYSITGNDIIKRGKVRWL
jgi:hydroxyethylthiazole kinase